MATSKETFLKELRDNMEAWHSAEIDYATFTACHRDTWHAIRQAGPEIESGVMRALCDQLPPVPDHAAPGPGRPRFRGRIDSAQVLCPRTRAHVLITLASEPPMTGTEDLTRTDNDAT